jgi:cytochrome P450/NADPH-cytochrome P450 reductase
MTRAQTHRQHLQEIPYGIRWLVPRGERFANFDLLNDNDSQLEYCRRFGHIYAVGIPTKKWRLVVVSDPSLLQEVAENEDQFGKSVADLNFFDQMQNARGHGISVIGDGEHYERVRRVMLPWFSPQHMQTQLPALTAQAQRMAEQWARHGDTPTDAHDWMERYALEVSGRGACNIGFNLLGAGEARPDAFAAAVPASTKQSIARVAEPYPDFTLLSGTAKRQRVRRYRQQREELYRTTDALVRARLHTCPVDGQPDLLSRLVSSPDPESGEPLDETTIRDQILMHLSNGFLGPSIVGAWLAYLLATHPAVQDQVLTEIDQITGGDPDYVQRWDDLMSLPYLTRAIKETLRLYPPMPVTIRRSLKDGALGPYRVRNRDVILVGALAAHYDQRYWGQDAASFDPEHFAPDRVAARPLYSYLPFQIGKRQCMAQEFTYVMLRVVFFELGKRYRFDAAPGTTVEKNTIVTTKPGRVPVTLIRRLAPTAPRHRAAAAATPAAPAVRRDWGPPTEVPAGSAFGTLLIGYGSNFGACKDLAERFAERAHYYGYRTEVHSLNDLAGRPPAGPSLLVVFTSTYTANPPSNAAAFKAALAQASADANPWRQCKFAVFGLGNSQWNAFLAFPRYVHTRLGELGAEPVADLANGDVGMRGWERSHADWNTRLWPLLHELSGATATEAAAARVAAERQATGALTGADSNMAMAMSLTRADAAPRVLLVPKILSNSVGAATITAHARGCRELQSADSSRHTRHIELVLPQAAEYAAGAHLGVCPRNSEAGVERLAARLHAALDGLFMVPQSLNVRVVPKGVVLQVRNVLTNLVDIGGPPTTELVELMITMDPDPAERADLQQIGAALADSGEPPSPLRAALDAGGYDVLRLLEEHPACRLNIFEFLQVAQPLRPRYYSPSSSPRLHTEAVHLTVGLEEVAVAGEPGRVFRGTSSGYLHGLREGDKVNIFLQDAAGFHLQDDVSTPMIFVSVGTGFAPMRAFLWERWALHQDGVTLGEAALFNGIRSRRQDYIYRDEIEMFAQQGIVDHLHVVASRDGDGRHEHVDDRLREQGALLWRLLQLGGYVYVCGSQAMRVGVHQAFVDVIAHHAPMSTRAAENYLKELEMTENRYRPDLWG